MTRQITVLVCGSKHCGKTSLIRRITEKKFSADYNSSQGVQGAVHTATTADGEKIRIFVKEEGAEDYTICSLNAYNYADAYIIVYDISNQASLQSIKSNCDMVRKRRQRLSNSVIIVGNKCDRYREIQQADIEAYTNSEDIAHIEISARTDTNVDEMLKILLSRKFPYLTEKTDSSNINTTSISNVKPTSKSGCCVIT